MGMDNDENSSVLIERIICSIAQASPSERIQCEVELLNEIHQCIRVNNKATICYANRFEAKVANYVHQKKLR